jgi:DNA-binding GntR family transcriptional regulator
MALQVLMIESKYKIRTSTDQVASYLRDAILSGKLKSGARLRENEIATLMGISRSPIREAFRILESEGLVQIAPNKGVTVSRLTEKDLNEIYEIRMLLEQYGLENAWKQAPSLTLEELGGIIKRMEDHLRKKDFLGFLKASHEFHECFMKRCKNQRFLRIYRIVWNNTRTVQIFAHSYMEPQAKTLMEEHRKIFKALKENALERAVEDLKIHLVHGLQRAKAFLKMT